ncbi:hypothetical protein AB0D38_05505 [Streptomyces sp. NPDC048279]|uniref:hypothetical protein n=1 Tax=Streptomyces sp. NPDC048279 TaxID=3154714 RepID=UPI0034431DA3
MAARVLDNFDGPHPLGIPGRLPVSRDPVDTPGFDVIYYLRHVVSGSLAFAFPVGADLLRVWHTCGFVRIEPLVATEQSAADLPVCLSWHPFVRVGAERPGVTDTA